MIKHEFIFRDNIAIIRDTETQLEMIHQPMRPTWGEPTRWSSEEEAREWAYSEFSSFFEDTPDPVITDDVADLAGNVVVTDNTTPGA